mgnify:FL=1|jgi:hypothetical protein
MKDFKEFISEALSKKDLDEVERAADKLFAKVGIDVVFSKHFIDRVNDIRNKNRPISGAELVRIYKLTYKKYGKKIPKLGEEGESVLFDINSNLNIPFILHWDDKNHEFDMVSKTVMRTPNFKSVWPKLRV